MPIASYSIHTPLRQQALLIDNTGQVLPLMSADKMVSLFRLLTQVVFSEIDHPRDAFLLSYILVTSPSNAL